MTNGKTSQQQFGSQALVSTTQPPLQRSASETEHSPDLGEESDVAAREAEEKPSERGEDSQPASVELQPQQAAANTHDGDNNQTDKTADSIAEIAPDNHLQEGLSNQQASARLTEVR